MTTKRVTCIGIGMIGASWATLFSIKGCTVKLFDVKEGAVPAALQKISDNLDFLIANGILDAERKAQTMARIQVADTFECAVCDAEWIQESAFESYEVKQALLTEIDRYAPADAVYATSSSGLSIRRIAEGSQHPERCIVAHPYNPVYLMPLVEVVGACREAAPVVAAAVEFLQSLGKEPAVLKKEAVGFIANRLQIAVQREICHMVYQGIADIESIDKAMTFGLGLRWAIMGPSLITHLGSVNAKTMIETLGKTTNVWLKDLADFKDFPEDWGDVLQAGVDAEIAHRPHAIGDDNASLRVYRDDMLLKLLALHEKLDLN